MLFRSVPKAATQNASCGNGNCLFRRSFFNYLAEKRNHLAVYSTAVCFENISIHALSHRNKQSNDGRTHAAHSEARCTFLWKLWLTLFNVPIFCLGGTQQHYIWHCVEPIRQHGLHHPAFAESPLKDVTPPTHFELLYIHNTHYHSIISTTGALCEDFPTLNTQGIYVDLS